MQSARKVASLRIQPVKQLCDCMRGGHRPLSAGDAAQLCRGFSSARGAGDRGDAECRGLFFGRRRPCGVPIVRPLLCAFRGDAAGGRIRAGPADSEEPALRGRALRARGADRELRPGLSAPGREQTARRARRGLRCTDCDRVRGAGPAQRRRDPGGGGGGGWDAETRPRCEDADPGTVRGTERKLAWKRRLRALPGSTDHSPLLTKWKKKHTNDNLSLQR